MRRWADSLTHPGGLGDPQQVVMVWEDASAAGFPRNTPSPANYLDWVPMNRSFTDMAAAGFVVASLTDGAPEAVLGRRVTANFFPVLGVQPQLDLSFTAEDDRSGARAVMIGIVLTGVGVSPAAKIRLSARALRHPRRLRL